MLHAVEVLQSDSELRGRAANGTGITFSPGRPSRTCASSSPVMVENPPPEGASTASVNFTQREWSVSLKVEETRCMSSFVVVS